MKKLFLLIVLSVSSLSYSSPCEDEMKSPGAKLTGTTPTNHELLKLLEHSDVKKQLQAVTLAGEVGEPAFPVLRQALENSEEIVRLRAVEVALKIGESALEFIGPKWIFVLNQTLESSSEYIRSRVFKLTLENGLFSFLKTEKLSVLRKAMESSDISAGLRAIELALEIDSKPALSLIKSKGLPALDRSMEYSIREESSFMDESGLVRVKTSSVGFRVLDIIEKVGEPAFSVLKKALEHPNFMISDEAVRVAKEIGSSALSLVKSKRMSEILVLDRVKPSKFMEDLRAIELALKMGSESALSLIKSKGLSSLEQAMERPANIPFGLYAIELALKIGNEPALSLIESKGLSVLDRGMRYSGIMSIGLRAVKLALEIGSEPALSLVKSKGFSVLDRSMDRPEMLGDLRAIEAALKIGSKPALSLILSKGIPALDQAMKESIQTELEYGAEQPVAPSIGRHISSLSLGLWTVDLLGRIGENLRPAALAKRRTGGSVISVLEQAVKHPNEKVRQKAAKVIQKIQLMAE